jgi:chorismate dehydratase
MMAVRVGAVNYLNTKPLIEGFGTFAPQAELCLDLPSRLADRLAAGDLDVALIPVIEYFRAGPRQYTIVPGVAIASHGPVWSVTLYSRVPWDQVRSVALDEGSRTSAALARILLEKKHGLRPQTLPLPIGESGAHVPTDAVLLIGDRAMRSDLPGFPYRYDLGEEWFTWKGLPFVFAVWAVRHGVDLEGVDEALRLAKVKGLEQVASIARREAPRLHQNEEWCRRYLSEALCFDLGPREVAGLREYYSHARDLGLAPAGVDIEFYRPGHLVESR